MHVIAYYQTEHDAAGLCDRVKAELAECLLPASHYALDYATSASTVIYVHIIKRTSRSSIATLIRAFEKASNGDPPKIIFKDGLETEHQDVFEPRQASKF